MSRSWSIFFIAIAYGVGGLVRGFGCINNPHASIVGKQGVVVKIENRIKCDFHWGRSGREKEKFGGASCEARQFLQL